jgi:hypothetical protein
VLHAFPGHRPECLRGQYYGPGGLIELRGPPARGAIVGSKLVARQQISETHEFAKYVVFQRGTSRYVFTTDVSVNEVQAFICDLVLVLGWFTPLGPHGR